MHSLLQQNLQSSQHHIPLKAYLPIQPPAPSKPPASVVPKKYPCTWEACKSTFTRRTDLVRHLRQHTNEKPYSCDRCGKSFTQHSSLKSHQKTHAIDKPFECKICAATFTEIGAMKRHEKLHFGVQVTCDICGRGYTRKEYLRKHIEAGNCKKEDKDAVTKPILRLPRLPLLPSNETGLTDDLSLILGVFDNTFGANSQLDSFSELKSTDRNSAVSKGSSVYDKIETFESQNIAQNILNDTNVAGQLDIMNGIGFNGERQLDLYGNPLFQMHEQQQNALNMSEVKFPLAGPIYKQFNSHYSTLSSQIEESQHDRSYALNLGTKEMNLYPTQLNGYQNRRYDNSDNERVPTNFVNYPCQISSVRQQPILDKQKNVKSPCNQLIDSASQQSQLCTINPNLAFPPQIRNAGYQNPKKNGVYLSHSTSQTTVIGYQKPKKKADFQVKLKITEPNIQLQIQEGENGFLNQMGGLVGHSIVQDQNPPFKDNLNLQHQSQVKKAKSQNVERHIQNLKSIPTQNQSYSFIPSTNDHYNQNRIKHQDMSSIQTNQVQVMTNPHQVQRVGSTVTNAGHQTSTVLPHVIRRNESVYMQEQIIAKSTPRHEYGSVEADVNRNYIMDHKLLLAMNEDPKRELGRTAPPETSDSMFSLVLDECAWWTAHNQKHL